jgi:alkanesulfonate monooxygenase SsuD/methylene tetrahydromethanopterin reductase-like flavin-dependent oxidoreductase (luciferase family)
MARLGESLGFSEMWLPEDYFFVGAIAGAGIALSVTERIPFGIGIASCVVRSPALLAQEIATLDRAFPQRIIPGIGLGWPGWLQQMGLHPESQLDAVRECLDLVRRLLAGEEVTFEGRVFHLNAVKLTHPPRDRVPLYAGVMGPRMLRVAGEVADGTLLGVTSSVKYVKWARDRIAEGAAKAERTDHHKTPCLVIFAVDNDGQRAKASIKSTLAFYLSILGRNAYTEAYGNSDELEDMIARGGMETIEREMPDQWVEDLVIAGDPEECAAKITRFRAAGAETVVLYPPAETAEDALRLAASEVMPCLH